MNNLQKLEALNAEESDVVDPEMILEQVLADEHLQQQITRTNRDGIDSIVSYFRCRFEKGQQRFTVHLPITPAMNSVPEIQAMAVDHDQAVVRITDRHPFGLRAEVVLPRETETELQVMIELIATSPIRQQS